MMKHAPVRSRLAGGALVIALAAGLAPTAALASEPSTDSDGSTSAVVEQMASQAEAVWNTALETGDPTASAYFGTYSVSSDSTEDATTSLPATFDLRKLGVVTSVKNQFPWNTCWAFATIAASETSISYELGLNNTASDAIDLSERHLAYFARTPIDDPESSQNGEGAAATSGASGTFNAGGAAYMATTFIAGGVGVVEESTAPYKNDEGYMVDAEGNRTDNVAEASLWSTEGTWSLDESLRFTHMFELEESNLLPAPYIRTGEDTSEVNEEATAAIKQELMEGRAVVIGFCADWYSFTEDATEKYINTETWSHYTYDFGSANHAATIVGWDDNYPASNFLDGHEPPGDGAWIVKNSLGSEGASFPNYGDYGDGYIYISYYDKSLTSPTSFDYDVSSSNTDDDSERILIDQYDFMGSTVAGPMQVSSETENAMANVFAASEDQYVRTLSCVTGDAGATVTYRLYLLDDDATNPTDGVLAATATETYTYAGFHRVDLDEGVAMRAGQRYAVTVTQQAPNGTYQACYAAGHTEEAVAHLGAAGAMALNCYSIGVINEGESYYYSIDNGWTDWTQYSASLGQQISSTFGYQYFTYDNPSIKAYADPHEFGTDYTDVDYGAWYADSVKYAAAQDFMTGYAGTSLFGVGDTLTRAQLVVALWRAAEPEAAAEAQAADGTFATVNETGLADVEDNAYYTAAANWAVTAGVVHGVANEDGTVTFEPDAPATVEQLATVLWNYSQVGAGNVEALAAFTDGADASDWAREAMAWAVDQGYINGYLNADGSRTLLPKENVARERMAAIVANAHKAGLFG